MPKAQPEDLGFTFLETKKGNVMIHRDGKRIVVLSGKQASKFLHNIDACTFGEQQQRMARATGNYKRGNERLGKNQPKYKR